MEKLAFLFPGQGAQHVGMGRNLYNEFEIVRQTFEEANDILGFDLAEICFNGPITQLDKPENVQVAILAVSIAAYRAYIQQIGVLPQLCAGHSLGEYSALTCAGAMRFSDALKIVRLRGELTGQAIAGGTGAMTIITGLDKKVVEEECRKATTKEQKVYISCYNSKKQLAISGHLESVQAVEDMALELGGQFTPLLDGAAFHSPLMEKDAQKLRELLEKFTYGSFRYPVISNVKAQPYTSGDSIPDILTSHMLRPVQWEATAAYLNKHGITLAIELGPKAMVSALLKENVESIDTLCFGLNEDRKILEKRIVANNQLRVHVPTVINRCLSAAVATPNRNWNNEEYQKGVVEQYQRLLLLKAEADIVVGGTLNIEQEKESLDILKTIFDTKKLPLTEQKEWFSQILDETGTIYTLADKVID